MMHIHGNDSKTTGHGHDRSHRQPQPATHTAAPPTAPPSAPSTVADHLESPTSITATSSALARQQNTAIRSPEDQKRLLLQLLQTKLRNQAHLRSAARSPRSAHIDTQSDHMQPLPPMASIDQTDDSPRPPPSVSSSVSTGQPGANHLSAPQLLVASPDGSMVMESGSGLVSETATPARTLPAYSAPRLAIARHVLRKDGDHHGGDTDVNKSLDDAPFGSSTTSAKVQSLGEAMARLEDKDDEEQGQGEEQEDEEELGEELEEEEELEEGEVSATLVIVPAEACARTVEHIQSYQSLAKVPTNIFTFRNLHTLTLSHNVITHIPDELFDLNFLVELDLSHNRLAEIPPGIGRLASLVNLDVRNNAIESLPDELANCEAIEMLYLSGNNFYRFPPVLSELKSLIRLHLGSNQLRSLPRSIAKLSNLQTLYLGGNQLRSVPPSLCMLQQLRLLYLGENRLTGLPNFLNKLENLRTLNIHANNIVSLPSTLVELPNLEQLSLRNNPLLAEFVAPESKGTLSLQELCGRAICNEAIAYCHQCLPLTLCHFLDSAKHCANPSCRGVFFTEGVKTVQFVDFCGKFHIPITRYLCSNCEETPSLPEERVGERPSHRHRKLRRLPQCCDHS